MSTRPWHEPPPSKWIQDRVHDWYGTKNGAAYLMAAALKFRDREREIEQRREQIGGH